MDYMFISFSLHPSKKLTKKKSVKQFEIEMKKMIKVEVCIISARGLKRPSSLWKPQWFAVGWIDPNNKYCTKIDASGTTNPSWKTKFSAQIESIDDDGSGSHSETALHVQVYSREPIFLRERIQGTATVLLKEFLKKKRNSSETPPSNNYHGPGSEEVGSFQLRKKNSGKPQGFVDVSIRVFYDRDGGHGGNSTSEGGIGLINLTSTNDGNEMHTGGGENGWGSAYSHPPSQSHQPLPTPNWQQQNYPPPTAHQMPPNNNSNWQQQNYPPPIAHQMPPNNNSNGQQQNYPPPIAHPNNSSNWQQQNYPSPIAHQMPPNNNSNQPSSSSIGGGPSYYHHPSTQPPPPPPPPSHVGYLPSFFPRTDPFAGTSSSGAGGIARPGHAGGNGFRMGAATGALAAGAVIFGDDFMSGFDVPSMNLQDEDPYSITISKTNPPF